MEINDLGIIILVEDAEVRNRMEKNLANIGVSNFYIESSLVGLYSLFESILPIVVVVDEAMFNDQLVQSLRSIGFDGYLLLLGEKIISDKMKKRLDSIEKKIVIQKDADQLLVMQKMKMIALNTKKISVDFRRYKHFDRQGKVHFEGEVVSASETQIVIDFPIKLMPNTNEKFSSDFFDNEQIQSDMFVLDVKNNPKGKGFNALIYLRNYGERFLTKIRRGVLL